MVCATCVPSLRMQKYQISGLVFSNENEKFVPCTSDTLNLVDGAFNMVDGAATSTATSTLFGIMTLIIKKKSEQYFHYHLAVGISKSCVWK